MTKQLTNVLIPDYYNEFSCIGSRCEDTCCAGWGIQIDKKTFKDYKKISNRDLNREISSGIRKNPDSKGDFDFGFMKMSNGSCSFLNEDRLCSIQINLGEEYLCNTCTMYPRRYNSVNSVIEKTLSLSCPEAARKILLNEKGITFNTGSEKVDMKLISSSISLNSKTPVYWQDLFEEYRYFTIYLLQNRNYSLDDRLIILGLFTAQLDELVENKKIDEIPLLIGEFLNSIDNLELKEDLSKDIKRPDLQLKLSRELVILRLQENITSSRYLECSREMIEGLLLNQEESEEKILNNYLEKYKNIYVPFVNNHEYILENYLVNYCFKNCFPIDNQTSYESYTKLIVHYLLLKTHLIGMGAARNQLTPEMAVKLIQSISKTFEHNVTYFNNVMEQMKETGLLDFNYINLLIKN